MAEKSLVVSLNQESHVDSESDDEEVVEASPCGRWEKHRNEVRIDQMELKLVGLVDRAYLIPLRHFTISV